METALLKNWWFALLWGILAILFGFWIMFRPLAGTITIVALLGSFFLIEGLYNIGFSFALRSIKKEMVS